MAHQDLKNRIEELEDELRATKVNKRTEMAVGLLKSKISQLKEQLQKKTSKQVGSGVGFAIRKEGDATIGLLGKPSVGKSTILSKLTNKQSKIGDYEFTTLSVIPGLLNYNHTNLQILDLPGIIEKAADNRGFGKKVLSVVRVCNLVVLVVDIKSASKDLKTIIEESNRAQIRFNEERPKIEIKKTSKKGIQISINNSQKTLPNSFIKQVISDRNYTNCEVFIYEKKVTPTQFVQSCYESSVYVKAIICLNKIDTSNLEEQRKTIKKIKKLYPQFPVCSISAQENLKIEEFKQFVWEHLNFIYIFLKESKSPPNFREPLVVKKGDTIESVCLKIHKNILKTFKFAKIKGTSVKFDWQQVGLSHTVQHKDIIEIHSK